MKINCNPHYNVKYTVSVITLLLLSSCGARKVELEQQKVRTQQLTEMVLRLQNDIQSNVKVNKVATKKIVEPVDPKLPSTYNGQDFQNARITEEETTTDSTATMNDNSTTDLNVSNETDNSADSKKRNVDREGNKSVAFIWGLVFLLFLVIFGKWKKWF